MARMNYGAARARQRMAQGRKTEAMERTRLEAIGLSRSENVPVASVLAELLGEHVKSMPRANRVTVARDGFGNVVTRKSDLGRYHKMTLQWFGLDGTNVAIGQVMALGEESLMLRVASVGRELAERLTGYGLDVVQAPSGFVVRDCERDLGLIRGYMVAPSCS